MTLAQLKAEAASEAEGGDRGGAGAVMDVIKKIFNRLFGPDERPPAPPMHEIGSTDINLISANKHTEGGDANMSPHSPGGDAWLKNLPNMGPFKSMLFAQVDEFQNPEELDGLLLP